MAIYRILEKSWPDDHKTYHVHRRIFYFWFDVTAWADVFNIRDVIAYRNWFTSYEEAHDVVKALLNRKKLINKVVWTNEPQPKMNY